MVKKMDGWILYRKNLQDLSPEAYEINRFIEEAEKENINLKVFKPEEFDLVVTREDRQSMLVNATPAKLPQFMLPRMGAGTTYFALGVIRHLERLGVHTFNSAASIDTVKDKLYTHQILAQNNLPVPKTMLVKFPIDVNLVEKYIGFPVVVKTVSGSQGSGVYLCDNQQSFEDMMQFIKSTKSNTNIILQEYIESSHGRDLRVFVIGGRAMACMQRTAHDDSFKANFSRGGLVEEFPITPEIEWLATETSRILGLEIAGIDLLFDGDHYKICEANSSPGFEGIESCCSINIPKEIYTFLKIRLGLFE